jgi:hypothetical protein
MECQKNWSAGSAIMNVMAIKHIEDCFDGTLIKEFVLDREITKDFILYLGQLGNLQYFPDFARPFFKINAQGFGIKGIQDNTTLRVLLVDKTKLDKLTAIIQQYIDTGGDSQQINQ